MYYYPNKQIDKAFLASYYGDMVDKIGHILEKFLTETPGQVNEILNLVNNNMLIEAEHKIHKTIPSFVSVGLPTLCEELTEIEFHIKNKRQSLAKFLMMQFQTDFNRYKVSVVTELERLQKLNNTTPINSFTN